MAKNLTLKQKDAIKRAAKKRADKKKFTDGGQTFNRDFKPKGAYS